MPYSAGQLGLGRNIICGFKVFASVKAKYPNRNVYPEAMCPNDQFAYCNHKGHVRMVKPDGSIWECDEDAGYPWMRKIWPRRAEN